MPLETRTITSAPHPLGDVLLLGTDGIGVDRRGGEVGVSEPFLDEVEGDSGGDGGDAEAVAQSFGRGVWPVELGGVHDGVNGAPSGHPAPRPETNAAALACAAERNRKPA